MKAKIYLIYLSILAMVSAFSPGSYGQQSTNVVDYQVTFDNTTGVYSVWVVPNYNSVNANNPLSVEYGATAQVTLKVPTSFIIGTVTNVAGDWNSSPLLKLGPAEQPQFAGQGLPAGISYYVIGKGSSETNYGPFSIGVPVKLFTFTGNGCFGGIEVLSNTDPFVTVADNILSLNTAPSFYSRSGQPAGGTQEPLEQFRAPFGAPANCLLAIDDNYTAEASVPINQPVLTNDEFNGVVPATSTQVQVTIATNPPNGTVSVNPGDGSITYTANPGFSGIDTYTYTICDLSNLTVCSTATVTVTVACPVPVTPTVASIVQPTCLLATGSMTISNYDAANTYTFTGPTTNPVNTNGVFSGFAAGSYTVTSTNASGCISAPATFVINAQPPTPVAPTINNIVQPTCLVATGSVSVSNYDAAMTYTFAGGPTTNPTNVNGLFSGFAPGSYTVTATNASGCVSAPATPFVINAQPPTPVAPTVSTIVQPTCLLATGSLTISNYTAANTYTFTGPTTNPVNNNGVFSGFAAGSYSVTATNGSGCVSAPTTFVIAAQPPTPLAPALTSIVQPTCLVGTGSITIAPYDATNTYTFTGPTTNPTNTNGTFSGLAPGNYTVTATNTSGCVSSPTTFVINAQPPTPATPTIGTIVEPTCLVATGSMTISNYNGANTYTFTGPTTNPVNTNGTFSGLAPGSYTVKSTNTSGCESPAVPFVIAAQPLTPATPTVTGIVQPTCLLATGSMTISNYSATNTYTFTGPTTTPVNTNGTFSGFAAGSYTVTSTNASGCISAPATFVINAQPPTPLAPTIGTIVQPTCLLATGSMTISNYDAAMTYTFTGPTTNPLNTNGTFSGFAPGSYTVTATNSFGCVSAPASFVINAQPPTPATPTVTGIVQPTCSVATGSMTISNYDAAMTYTFSGPTTTPVNTNGTFSGFAPGSYTVTATNGSGCISAPASFVINAQPITPGVPTVISPLTYCRNAAAVALTATAPNGATLLWYTVPTNGVGSSTAPVPSTSAVGSVTYYVSSVSTSAGACESARVPLVVEVVDCRIIYAYNDNNVTPKNTPVSGQVLTNDDINNGTGVLVVATTPIQQPSNGSVVLNANGTYTYTPNPNFVGVDSFRYRVCDQGSPVVCDIATVYIKIYDDNDPLGNNPPIALVDIYATPLNTPVNGSVLPNDKDPDVGQTLTATQTSNPSNGTVTSFNPDGTFTYVPNPGFLGTDTFTYTACDNGNPTLCDDAVVQIEVKDTPLPGENMPPVAIDDYNTTVLNTPVTGNVSINDKDSEPNPTPLTVNTTPISGPLNGSIVLSPNGDYTYTPTNGFTGVDQVVYETCDAGTPIECARATLFIYVLDGQVALLPQAYLQGSLFGVTGSNLMRDDLRVKGLIPLASPYAALGFTALTPTVNTTPAVLAVTGPDAIVDWVFVELRSGANSQLVEDSRPALIQRDGDIVEVDGVSAMTFSQVSPGSYYVVVKHRNHLGVMTAVPYALSSTPATVDFRNPSTPTFRKSGSINDQAQVVVDQGVALWAGNTLPDGQVIYQGTTNDVNPIYNLVTLSPLNQLVTPFFKVKTYNLGDVNMNGETIFQGTGNDVEFIYQNVIKNHPGNSLKLNFYIIREQLP